MIAESDTQRRHSLKECALRLLLLAISCIVSIGLAEVTARVFFPISDGRDNLTLDGKPVNGWFEWGSVYRQVSNEYDAITTITDKRDRVPGVRGGSGNSDSMVSGSLASPTPPRGGESKGRGNEENTTESWSDL